MMQRAIRMDETGSNADKQRIAQLETENKTLRELLMIGVGNSGEVARFDKSTQVDLRYAPSAIGGRGAGSETGLNSFGGAGDEEDHHFVKNDDEMNSSVIENKGFKLENFLQDSDGAGQRLTNPLRTSSRSREDSVGSSTDSSVSLNESAERIYVGKSSSAAVVSVNSLSNKQENGSVFDGDTSKSDTTIGGSNRVVVSVAQNDSETEVNDDSSSDSVNHETSEEDIIESCTVSENSTQDVNANTGSDTVAANCSENSNS